MKQPPLLAGCWSSRQATAAVRRAGRVLPESTMKASLRRRRPALDLGWPDDPAAYWTDGVVRQSAALRRGTAERICSAAPCQRLTLPFFQLIRPLPMMNAKVARPTGHHTMKPRITRAIQAGFPNSSSFTTIGMKASLVNVNYIYIEADLLVKRSTCVGLTRHGPRTTLSSWRRSSAGGRAR